MTSVYPDLYPALLNFSSAATSVGPSPEIASRLTRLVAPAARSISRAGMPSAFAIKRTSAALRALLGVSLTASATPPAVIDQGLPIKACQSWFANHGLPPHGLPIMP